MSKMLFRLFSLALLPAFMQAFAQQSLFQSASGDNTIFLPTTTGVLSYNLGTDQARFDFNYDFFAPRAATSPWSFGGGGGGTVKKGTGTIVNKSAPANGAFGEVGVALRFSRNNEDQLNECVKASADPNGGESIKPGSPSLIRLKTICHAKNGQFLLGQFHYGYSEFYNLVSTKLPLPDPTKVTFSEYRGTIALNLLRTTIPADWRIGTAYVLGSANNLSDLKQQSYQSQVISSTSSGQAVLSSSPKDVYVGAYSTHTGQQINVDVVFQPTLLKHQFAADGLFRSDLGGGPKVRYASPGLGIFFFAKGKPIVPVAGVTYTYRAGNNQLAISTGWSFGGAATQ
ncbi:hypothetical protein DYQ86_15700 [Acidobacteria bacterium AB60]|nr:hypothetical protein DYQ86_15700 [Acidobacteria bacterium AB60]